jgi:nucleotide-binding universal stress UspA family protein
MRKTVLVPLDGSPGGETVLEEAAGVARANDAAVRLLQVVPRPEALVVDGRTVAYADDEAHRLAQDTTGYLAAVAERLRDLPVETAVRFGDPAEQILAVAGEPDVVLVAMATHRRAGLDRLVHGSVAERVDRKSPVPVLLVGHAEASPPVVRLRRIWCAEHREEVEVEFEMRGLPGLRHPAAVRSCTAFDPPTAVACSRGCLDPVFRKQWEPPLPVRDRLMPSPGEPAP